MKLRLTTSASDHRLLDERQHTRSTMWIMAIMLFLTVLAAGFGLAVLAASSLLDRQLAGRLTLQLIEANETRRDQQVTALVAALSAMPNIAHASVVDRKELVNLLRPWLGADGSDPDLPIPAMIDVDVRMADDAAVRRVETAVKAIVPAARVDRHERWMSPVSNFMRLIVGLAFGLVLLLATATATVVILVGRAGLETHRNTIDVLHILGSTDLQVARLFQRRIALDTLFGGVIGTGLAVLAIIFLGMQAQTLGSDLLSGVALGPLDWILLLALPVLFAMLATLAARFSVLRTLRRLP